MVIRIESLEVENLRTFQGENRLDFGQRDGPSIDVITGYNATGKTTLADSIQLCLSGEYEVEYPLVSFDLVDQLAPGEEVTAKVSVTISDSELGHTFRFSRTFQTSETRRGPINSVDSIKVRREEQGEWAETGSSHAINSVYPVPAFTFSKIDDETSLGFEDPWGGTSLSDLVNDLAEAAAHQSVARGLELPNYFSDDYSLSDELIHRVNDYLTQLENRFRVEERQDGLIARRANNRGDRMVYDISEGQKLLLTQIVALVAGELMPAAPPLIGDTMFARMNYEFRNKVMDLMQETDRHIILFSNDAELQGLELTPRYKLELDREDRRTQILSME